MRISAICIADEAKVTVDGVGSVYVHPKDTLDATMNGVGAILYTRQPARGEHAHERTRHDRAAHGERSRRR